LIKNTVRTTVIVLFILGLVDVICSKERFSLTLDPIPKQINAVRFDPSYYYDSPLKIDQLALSLVENWYTHGVNTIFYKAYDPIYGAKYRSSYQHNILADYGKQDLLKYILKSSKKYGISVFAWIPAFQHKSAWEAQPDWREKLEDGSDYKPNKDSYFLCPANPQVREWWLGFLEEILKSYKNIVGIDVAEPIIRWRSGLCFCDVCKNSSTNNILFSSDGLTETLTAAIRLTKRYHKKACITTVSSAHQDGSIYTVDEQRNLTGFDLNGILNTEYPPDWICFELMWQQWADLTGDKKIFTPDWTFAAAKTVIHQVDGQATIIGHLEQTSFGEISVAPQHLSKSIYAAKRAGLEHIDIYDTHLIDEKKGWEEIEAAFKYVPTKTILVCSDPNGDNDHKQIASLLSHFKADVTITKISQNNIPSRENLNKNDVVFVVCVDQEYQFPEQFLVNLSEFQNTLCWIHYGVDQFLKLNRNRFGFILNNVRYDSTYNQVFYNEFTLPRTDPAFSEIAITDSSICHQIATLSNGIDFLPYAVKSDNFWYFVDLPTAFVIEGGRHIVFSDLLHDIIREDHERRPLALVRIEDVNPLTDPNSIKKIARYLKSQKVPFSLGLTPFYLNPETNENVALSDRPEIVEALKNIVRSGGSIIMHGSTHQYRGETTADYEFWDIMSGTPLFSDSKEYVRQRLITGLSELGKNKLYPIVWETPHYGASQLDYSVINTFFSTAYERRQTIDLHGSDQLLPYLIYEHTAGGKIIPENLGYIPLTSPDANPMLMAAQNNLAVRDGVASFFFHPFVDISVLKDIISGLKKLGYSFASPRSTNNWVKAPEYQVLTGEGHVELLMEENYFHDFFIDEKGKIKNEYYSDSTLTGVVSKTIATPDQWMYVAEKLPKRPKSFLSRTLAKVVPSVPKITNSIFGEKKPLDNPAEPPLKVAILYDSTAQGLAATDQLSFINALSNIGVDINILDVSKFLSVPSNTNLLIAPYAAARLLSEQQRLFLIRSLQSGLNVIFEKDTELSQNIGITPLERVIQVKDVIDEYFPQVGITWKESDSLKEFYVNIDYVSYYSDKDTELPIVIGGEYGEGKYLYFATYFDPVTGSGYGRFPYFIDLLKRQFNLGPTVRRDAVEIYFEPGDREDISIEDLIKLWRSNGVRRIYVSAWHFYENYAYDYERLINLAHKNAMLVYAWLEFPHVSVKFWDDHPEWREYTADGKEAIIDWRRHMALNIEPCKRAIFEELEKLLTNYNWDGVNLAELFYESQHGFERPQIFTPMNRKIRQTFKNLEGFDPVLLFDTESKYFWKQNSEAKNRYGNFRENQIINLHREFLNFLHQIKTNSNPDLQIIVTTIDNILSPQTGEGTAVNTKRIAELAKEFPFTLQIEDPQRLWSLGPERYTKILNVYSEIRKTMPLILDINVVPYRDMKKSNAPTQQPSGIELYNLAKAASNDGTRLAIYSEASIYEVDFPFISYVLASDVKEELLENSWIFEAPYTVNFLIDAKSHKDLLVDGNYWPGYYKGKVILPKGKHEVESFSNLKRFVTRFKSNTRLVNISGELISLFAISRGIEFEYESFEPNIVIISDNPKEILVDKKVVNPEIMKGELGYSIRLPAGTHHTKIFTQTRGTQFLRISSVFISGSIVFIGFSAGSILSLIYIRNSYRRRKNNFKKKTI
jgi:uncharacterized protein YdaL/uncharacterized lipoprotein YddW (UPF0748 family)